MNGIDDWEQIVPKTLSILRYLGGRVGGTSVGHHLHIDFPEAVEPAPIRSLFNLMHRFEPVIYGLVAPSRRTSQYSRPMPDSPRLLHGCRSMQAVRARLSNWERTRGLNLTHLFGREPRIEYRYHQGTLCETKARHHLRLALRLTDHAVTRNCQAAKQQTANDRKGFEALRYTIGLKANHKIYAKVSPELKETSKWLLRRWKAFNEDTGEET